MEKAKIRPLATPKPFNRSSQKLACMITSWMAPGMQNFVTIGLGVSDPLIRDFAVPLGWLVFCSFFSGFFNKATAYTPEQIFTQNTSNDVVPGKEVPFGGPDDYILYLDLYIYEKPPLIKFLSVTLIILCVAQLRILLKLSTWQYCYLMLLVPPINLMLQAGKKLKFTI